MKQVNVNEASPRRKFLQTIAAGTTVLGIASVMAPFEQLKAGPIQTHANSTPDEWFDKIKGKHKIVFDVPAPHEIFPFAWPRAFLGTNVATGTAEKDCSVVVILRHQAFPYAMEDGLWEKYNLGEVYKINDPLTKKPATRNPFWKPKAGDFKVPGMGNIAIGINELQDSGVMFCVCNMALSVNSTVMAEKMGLAAADVKAEWMKGILPGVELMPSGVWAVGRAQEKGCAYCFVG